MKTILETDRLVLREFVREDLDDFYVLATDLEITKYTGQSGSTREAVQQAMSDRLFADYRQHGFGRWATIYKPNQRLIGFAGLKFLPEVNEVDIGYRFLKDYWGQGLATEAARALLPYGFEHLQLKKIIGIVMVGNQASIRVLEKRGFRLESRRTYQGQDTVWYVLENPHPE